MKRKNRKNLLSFASVAFLTAAFLLPSCTKSDGVDDDPDPVREKIDIRATTERRTSALAEGRTSLGSNDEVLWSESDNFAVYALSPEISVPEVFSLVSGAGTTSATFSGYQPEGTSFLALYGQNSIQGNLTLTLPAEQPYVKDGFAPYVNPMAAVADDLAGGLSFRNLSGILELHITGIKTVESIQVSANFEISGNFSVNPETLEYTYVPDGTGAMQVRLTGINEELDASMAKRFYVVLPPATYESLGVEITNTDGTSVSCQTSDPIVVERNQIVPVMGLVDGEEELRKPIAEVFVDQEKSNWHYVEVYTQKSPVCEQFTYMYATDEYIKSWMEEHPGKTERDMVYSEGGVYFEDIRFNYENYPGTTYHFYTIGHDAEGTEYPLSHITYTMEMPYDPALEVTANIPEESIGETSVQVEFTATGGDQTVYASVWQKTDFGDAGPVWEQMLYTTALSPEYQVEVSDGGGTVAKDLAGLFPNRNYILFVLSENSEGRYSQMKSYEFTTKEHISNNAAVTITEASIGDVQASFNMTLTNGAVSYKALIITKSTYEYYQEQGLNMADEIVTLDVEVKTDPLYTAQNLLPETDYYIVAVAFGSDGNYGPLCELPFRTTAYTPVDDPNFNQLLGDWMVSYTDLGSEGQGTPFKVTVSPDVNGKTFLITGLMASNPDASVSARFINGGICLDAGSLVMADGSREVRLALFSDGLLVLSGSYLGTLSGDRIVFAAYNVNYSIGGLVFAEYDPSSGYTGSYYPPMLLNLAFERIPEGTSLSSTQVFTRAEPVTPNWTVQ